MANRGTRNRNRALGLLGLVGLPAVTAGCIASTPRTGDPVVDGLDNVRVVEADATRTPTFWQAPHSAFKRIETDGAPLFLGHVTKVDALGKNGDAEGATISLDRQIGGPLLYPSFQLEYTISWGNQTSDPYVRDPDSHPPVKRGDGVVVAISPRDDIGLRGDSAWDGKNSSSSCAFSCEDGTLPDKVSVLAAGEPTQAKQLFSDMATIRQANCSDPIAREVLIRSKGPSGATGCINL